MVVVRFEFRLRRRAWVINVMNLLVQTVPHDERIRERQSMRFHRVAFLNKENKKTCHVQPSSARRQSTCAYPVVIFPDTLWKKVGHYRTGMGLLFSFQAFDRAFGLDGLTFTYSVMGCAVPWDPRSSK